MIIKASLVFLCILSFTPTDVRSLEIEEEKLIPYFVIGGQDAAKTYRFGYDTKKKGAPRLMREETRLPDGTVIGRYGYTDPFGVFRVVQYVAGNNGYYATEDIGGSSPSQPQFHKATARQLDERVVEDAPKSLSQQLATKFNPPLYHPEAHLAETPPIITKRRLETVEEVTAEKTVNAEALVAQPKILTTRRPEFNYYFSLGPRIVAQSSTTVTEPSVYLREQPVINKRFGVVDDKVINHRNSQFNNISFNTTKHDDIYANSDSSDILRIKTEYSSPLKENSSVNEDKVIDNIDTDDTYTESYDTFVPHITYRSTNAPNYSELIAEEENTETTDDILSTIVTISTTEAKTESTLGLETSTGTEKTVGYEDLYENIKHFFHNSERITSANPNEYTNIEDIDSQRITTITAATVTNPKPIETTETTIDSRRMASVTATTIADLKLIETTTSAPQTATSTESTTENIVTIKSSSVSASETYENINNSSDDSDYHNYDELITRNENINNFWQKRHNVLVWPSIVILNNQSNANNTNNSRNKFFDDYTFESLEMTTQTTIPKTSKTLKTEEQPSTTKFDEYTKLLDIEFIASANNTKELTSNSNMESIESETKISNSFTFSPLRVHSTSKLISDEDLQPASVTEKPAELAVTSNTAIKQFMNLMNNENRSFALIYDNTKNDQIFDRIVENIETRTETITEVSSTINYNTDSLKTENNWPKTNSSTYSTTNSDLNNEKVITVRYDSDDSFGMKISNNQIRREISDEKLLNDELKTTTTVATPPAHIIPLAETEKSIYDFDYSGDLLASAQEITTQSTITRLPPVDRITTQSTDTTSASNNLFDTTSLNNDEMTASITIKTDTTTPPSFTTVSLPSYESPITTEISETKENTEPYVAQPLPMFLGLPNHTPKRKRVRKVMKIRYRFRGSKRLHTLYDNENKNYLLAKDIELISPYLTSTTTTFSPPITTAAITSTTTPYPSTTENDLLTLVNDERFEFKTQPKPLFLPNEDTISPDMKPYGSRHRGSSYYVPPYSAMRLEFEGETAQPMPKYIHTSHKLQDKNSKKAHEFPISVTDLRNEIITNNDYTVDKNQTEKKNSSLESVAQTIVAENASLNNSLANRNASSQSQASGSEYITRSLTNSRVYKSPSITTGQRHAKYLFPLQSMISSQYSNDISRLTAVNIDNVPNNRN